MQIHNSNSLDKFISSCDSANKIKLPFSYKNFTTSNISISSIENIGPFSYDVVLVPSLTEGKFPSIYKNKVLKSPFEIDRDTHIKSELFLFQKIISKAKSEIYLSFVKRNTKNSIDSKPSRFLETLYLKPIKYEKEISNFSLDVKDEIKLEILEKIQKQILENNFDSAKSEIDLLKDLFGKQDLNSFIRKTENPSFNKYKNRLENTKLDLYPDIDTSKIVFSVSQLQTYDVCPKKYMFSYIYKVPSKPRHYFDFGTTIHTVLEYLAEDFDAGLSPEKLYVKGTKYMAQGWISKGYESAEQEKEYYEKGLKIIKEFIKKESNLRKENRQIIAQEKKFFLDFEGRTMMGIIDRVDKINDDEYEILDYKTSNSMETESSLSENFQLFVYAMAIKNEKEFGKYPKKVGLWYLLHDKILSVEPKYENLEKVKNHILSIIKKIESKNFEATPSDFGCRFCDFNTICSKSKFK